MMLASSSFRSRSARTLEAIPSQAARKSLQVRRSLNIRSRTIRSDQASPGSSSPMLSGRHLPARFHASPSCRSTCLVRVRGRCRHFAGALRGGSTPCHLRARLAGWRLDLSVRADTGARSAVEGRPRAGISEVAASASPAPSSSDRRCWPMPWRWACRWPSCSRVARIPALPTIPCHRWSLRRLRCAGVDGNGLAPASVASSADRRLRNVPAAKSMNARVFIGSRPCPG